MNDLDRLPPHDLAAEQSLLGSLLIDRDAIAAAAPLVDSRDFYSSANGLIFDAMLAMFARRDPIDLVTMTAELDRRGVLMQMGGVAYLSSLLQIVPTSVHAPHYAGIVSRMATLRRMIQAGTEIVRIGYDAGRDVEPALADALAALNAVRSERGGSAGVAMVDALSPFAAEIDARWQGEWRDDLFATGFYDLDRMIGGGFERGQLIVIGARPSIGKTAFALGIAHNGAKRAALLEQEPGWIVIFSSEMTLKALLWRSLAEVTGIPVSKLKKGIGLTPDQKTHIGNQLETMASLPIWIDDTSSPTTDQMRERVERLAAERPVRTVMFDYIEQAGNQRRGNESEEMRVSKVARDLKRIGKSSDVSMVALSQLNRAVETRREKMPTLADLRQSGMIEQEADIVMLLYRQDYYTARDMLDKDLIDPNKVGICDVNIAKQRDGSTGMVELQFVPELTAFRNVDRRTIPFSERRSA